MKTEISEISVLTCIGITLLLLTQPVHGTDPTTEVHVIKYASDETTVLHEMTKTYQWMESNLPVCGDGVTHYYHQGPVFDCPPGPWDENETTNFKDKGALKGTDIKDLCDLVGGMSPDDRIKISAVDGFNRWFTYTNVYEPQPCQGPMVLCWSRNGNFVPDYDEGMQIIFFADSSTNPENKHVFGAWDMHESFDVEYRYNYSGIYPSANGLSVKWIEKIAIYSTMDIPEIDSIRVSPDDVTLDIDIEQSFSATAYDQYENEMPDIIFEWISSNETVGEIDNTGLFSALAVGETTITVANRTISGTASVRVSGPVQASTSSIINSPVLTTIIISPVDVTLNVDKTQQFTAIAYDQYRHAMQEIDLEWISSNETVGSIDDAGLFTALSAGDTTIIVENEKVTEAIGITVSGPKPVPAPDDTPHASITSSQALQPTPESPGYGSLSMIIGLIIVSYMIKRKKGIP